LDFPELPVEKDREGDGKEKGGETTSKSSTKKTVQERQENPRGSSGERPRNKKQI